MGMGNAFGEGSYGMGYCLPRLDEALSALLVDLHERGLLERTLVVVTGEFGRTPRINAQGANPGRQHWPSCYTAIIAGGGIRGGVVYGQSDAIGAYVKDKPVRPQDLGATIYRALGVPRDLRLGKDGFTRPSAPASRSKPCSASRCHSQPVRPTLEVNYARQDSNLQPSVPKTDALSNCATALNPDDPSVAYAVRRLSTSELSLGAGRGCASLGTRCVPCQHRSPPPKTRASAAGNLPDCLSARRRHVISAPER